MNGIGVQGADFSFYGEFRAWLYADWDIALDGGRQAQQEAESYCRSGEADDMSTRTPGGLVSIGTGSQFMYGKAKAVFLLIYSNIYHAAIIYKTPC